MNYVFFLDKICFVSPGFWKFAGVGDYSDGGKRGGGGDSKAAGTEAKTGAKERPLPVRAVARSLQASSEKSYKNFRSFPVILYSYALPLFATCYDLV